MNEKFESKVESQDSCIKIVKYSTNDNKLHQKNE